MTVHYSRTIHKIAKVQLMVCMESIVIVKARRVTNVRATNRRGKVVSLIRYRFIILAQTNKS